jgi:hypothetical protein
MRAVALHDDPPYAPVLGRREHVGGSLGSQTVCLCEAAVEVVEVAEALERGRLVDDRVRLNVRHRVVDCVLSSTSSTTPSAPSERSRSAFPADRDVPVTSRPASASSDRVCAHAKLRDAGI